MKQSLTMRSAIVPALAALALAGCGGGGPTPVASETAAAEAPATAAPEPGASAPAPGEAAMAPPVEAKAAAAAGDPIRGPGGLEEKCLAAVAEEVGLARRMVSTNRIDESEAATDVYVNVPNATAPWKCHGYRNGTIDGVMFTGSEGAA